MKTASLLALATLLILAGSALFGADKADINAEPAPLSDTAMVDSAVSAGATAAESDGSFQYPMSPERHEKLLEYSQFKNVWRFVSFFVGLITLSFILFTGISAWFRIWASRIRIKFFALWAFTIMVLAADYILNLPFSIYRSYIVEDRFGFMNQTFWQWLGEDLAGAAIGFVFAIIPVFFFYWLVERTRRWWLWFAAGTVPILIVAIIIIPIFIQPLFNDYIPIQNQELKTELLALADQVGIEKADVFQVDASKQSAKINAYVTGLFGSKRIVLYDTLIKNFTTDEIRFVMAHEMGHYVMNHIWYGVFITGLFVLFAAWLMNLTIHPVIRRFRDRFGFDRLSDMASLPLVLIFLSVIMFVFQPVTNAWSRHIERQADRFGMEVSRVDGEVAATSFDKLAVYNLSDPKPSALTEFWFYDHPALYKRMEFVRNWKP